MFRVLVIPEGADDDAIEIVDDDVVMVDKSEGSSAIPGDVSANQTHNGHPGVSSDRAEVSKKRPTSVKGVVGESQEIFDISSGAAKKPKL